MTPMVFISHVGALEGNLVSTLRNADPTIPVFNERNSGRSSFGMTELPAWVEPTEGMHRVSRLTRDYYARAAKERSADAIIAVGTHAILRARSLDLDLPLIGVMPRGEVDFSQRRTRLARDFRAASAAADILFFDSRHEMDKAAGHGSHAPHRLLPLFGLRAAFLSADLHRPQVSVVVPSNWGNVDCEQILADLSSSVRSDLTLDVVTSGSAYTRNDSELSRGFPGTLRYRISRDTTHVLVLGDSPDHSSLIAALELNHPDRYVLDATISNREVSLRSHIDQTKVGQGAALSQKLAAALEGTRPRRPNFDAGESSDILDDRALIDFLADSLDRSYPWWHEDSISELTAREFDIFYSVAAIEDRADGARPMRIRSVSEEFTSNDLPTVRLSANGPIFKRRSEAIVEMLRNGARPRYFYGENSTSPMERATVDRLADLLSRTRVHGLKIGWFVRDLHWLSSDADYSANYDLSPEKRIERGLHEIRSMNGVVDTFFAPSIGSVRMFDDLLSDHQITGLNWSSLPPGTADFRVLPQLESASGPINLVYAGGYGDVYAMPTLLTALGRDHRPVSVDWFVRPEDTVRLCRDLESHGVSVRSIIRPAEESTDENARDERHRIRNDEFLTYSPDGRRNIGLVLLDSEYARSSFPFKIMSYLEKQIPVAVFSTMDAADFVETAGIGIVCDPADFSIETLVQQTEEFYAKNVDLQNLAKAQSWEARMREVRALLRSEF